jgi:predicted transcriptional regulator
MPLKTESTQNRSVIITKQEINGLPFIRVHNMLGGEEVSTITEPIVNASELMTQVSSWMFPDKVFILNH